MQYEDAVVRLPTKTDWLAWGTSTDPRDPVVLLGSQSITGPTQTRARVGILSSQGELQELLMDDNAGLHGPERDSVNASGNVPSAVVFGPAGYVAIGGAGFYSPSAAASAAVGLTWHSDDGILWSRTDLRPVTGRRSSVRPAAILATDDGYVVVAGRSDLRQRHRGQLVVLGSNDGESWRELGSIDSRWTLQATRIMRIGDRLLVAGVEYVCTSDSFYESDPHHRGIGVQVRLWSSADGGSTWTPVAIDDLGVVTSAEPAPTDEADCPRRDTSGWPAEMDERFATTGQFAGAATGMAVLVSGDGAKAAVSPDLVNWTVAELPGAIPAEADRFWEATYFPKEVVPYRDGVALLSLEPRRDERNRQHYSSVCRGCEGTGSEVMAWYTNDGTSWARLPAPRPFLINEIVDHVYGPTTMSAGADGSVRILEAAALQRAGSGWTAETLLTSLAGPHQPWGSCDPEAGADCRFATIDVLDRPGADLSGIDLTGATVRAGDLAGATLRGASLTAAMLSLPLSGADLTGVRARLADLRLADLRGADLDGADLTLTWLPGSIGAASLADADLRGAHVDVDTGASMAGANFSGMDLYRVSFNGPFPGIGNMRGVTFAGARLDYVSFSGVDLTGANFAGYRGRDIVVVPDVICPDGRPPRFDRIGLEACRIRP